MGLGSRSDLKRMKNTIGKTKQSPTVDTIGKTKQLPTHVVNAELSNREKVLMQANIAGGKATDPDGGKVKDQKTNYREPLGSDKIGINPKSTIGQIVSRGISLHKKAANFVLGKKSDTNMLGQCRNNTCVTAVGGYHKDAGLNFPDIHNNRQLDKSLRKGELSKEYKQVRLPKNVRKGDIVNFHEDKVVEGKVKKKYGYHTGIVNRIPENKQQLRSGENFTYVGSGGTEEKTPTRKIYKKGTLSNPFAKSKTRGIRYYTRRDS
jgi:hypothetical protein